MEEPITWLVLDPRTGHTYTAPGGPRDRRCPEADDDNPASYPHHRHPWGPDETLTCPGWFPLVQTRRGGIQFPTPAAED